MSLMCGQLVIAARRQTPQLYLTNDVLSLVSKPVPNGNCFACFSFSSVCMLSARAVIGPVVGPAERLAWD